MVANPARRENVDIPALTANNAVEIVPVVKPVTINPLSIKVGPSILTILFAWSKPLTSKLDLNSAWVLTSRPMVGFIILIPTFAVVCIPDAFFVQWSIISISTIWGLEGFTDALTKSPPERVPMKFKVEKEDAPPTWTPSFSIKIDWSCVGVGATHRIPLASRDRKYPLSPG